MKNPASILRNVLLLDAATCLATGLAMFALAGLLAGPLGLPVALLRWAGLSLLPFVGLLAHAARRSEWSRPQLWLILGLNALWVVDSVLLLVSGWVEPTSLGQAFVIGQACFVALLTELEFAGLRALGCAGAKVAPLT